MSNAPFIIGLDGGATKVSGWHVLETKNGFSLGSANSIKTYSDYQTYDSEFTPVDIQTQLNEIKSTISLTDAEKQHGQAFIEAFVDTISELNTGTPMLIGIGMPGLKTDDKRGIAAMANGPRMPTFCNDLEQALSEIGIKLLSLIYRLGSDADYCGFGEEYSNDGLFKSVSNSYYLGGGTGAADALKLNGKLLPFDETKSWLLKSWEMKNMHGVALERYASASGIQSIYSQYSGQSITSLITNSIYPNIILERAIQKEEAALNTFSDVSLNLAELLFERIETIYSGWKEPFGLINPNREPPSSNHPFLKIILDRLIIGQRLGAILEASKGSGIFWEPLVYHIGNLINKSNRLDSNAKAAYLNNDKLNSNLIHVSLLRDAPSLGAGIDAVLK
jgi:hypothetical protein